MTVQHRFAPRAARVSTAPRRALGALAATALCALALLAGCQTTSLAPYLQINNVFDELVLAGPVGYITPFSNHSESCGKTPYCFDDAGPSGTDPANGEYVSYNYEGSNLGLVWHTPATVSPLAKKYYRLPSLSAYFNHPDKLVRIDCETPVGMTSDGIYYHAIIGLYYTTDDRQLLLYEKYELSTYCEEGKDYASWDWHEVPRDIFLAKTGVDGCRLDAWAEHGIRDVFFSSYYAKNADATWFSQENPGEGVSLDDGFIAHMRESGQVKPKSEP